MGDKCCCCSEIQLKFFQKRKIMQFISSVSLSLSPPIFIDRFAAFKVVDTVLRFPNKQARRYRCFSRRKIFTSFCIIPCSCQKSSWKGEEEGVIGKNSEESRSRRGMLVIPLVSSGMLVAMSASGKVKGRSPYDERRLLEQNKKIQEANNAPEDFPNFVREGFQVNVVTSDKYVKRDSGLIYLDIQVGKGDCPKDGQQVTFHYVGYNESGRRIDSTYLQGAPAKIRLGNNALVPGFEEGIRDMRPGGKRRIIIPPELGPPVGPSTFFSAKQFEVFDVELLDVKDCQRRTIAFYSDVVCN